MPTPEEEAKRAVVIDEVVHLSGIEREEVVLMFDTFATLYFDPIIIARDELIARLRQGKSA